MIELRVRTRIDPAELEAKKGKIVTAGDYNALLTGQARVIAPDGKLLAVYLPGVLRAEMDAAADVLDSIRMMTDNRGMASGTTRLQRGDQKRTRTRRILSSTLGAVDPGPSSSRAGGRLPACRQTAWTAKHLEQWASLHPLWTAISGHYHAWVPDRWTTQTRWAESIEQDWRIAGTPFTTVTVNNTYSTGVHQDAGDLKAGFSTLGVCRRGSYDGGRLVLPEYRIAFNMLHGDLLLFDPHQWHGNTTMTCCEGCTDLAKPCAHAARISVVAYARTKLAQCGSADVERAKTLAHLG